MGVGHLRLPLRGGNWNNTASAGVFALNLNDPRVNSNHNVGFRSALLVVRCCILKGMLPVQREIKGAYFHADKAKNTNVMDTESRLVEIRNTWQIIKGMDH